MKNKLLSKLFGLLLLFSVISNTQASLKSGTRKVLEGLSSISYVITDVSLITTIAFAVGLACSEIFKWEKGSSFFLPATKISGIITGVSATAGYVFQKFTKYLK